MYFTWLNERQCLVVLLNFLVLSYLVTGFSILSNIWKTFASVLNTSKDYNQVQLLSSFN